MSGCMCGIGGMGERRVGVSEKSRDNMDVSDQG